jgi:hypothetical protein
MTMVRVIDVIRGLAIGLYLLAFAAMAPGPAGAQSPDGDAKLSEAQLEQLVAPIALYPDALLSQVLMAATYPPEVVEAARWSQANPAAKGLEDAMQKQSWDPSVKGLTAAPQVLTMMSDKLYWTQQLGDAVLAQQQDVLSAVQTLRARADAAGNLKTTAQQTVMRHPRPAGTPTSGPQQVITIEPTSPDTYYMPIYDPSLVYGAWARPDYPPYNWHPSGWVPNHVLLFAAGVVVGAAIWGGVDWWRRNVNINVDRFNEFNRTRIANNTWTHDPRHRGNVPYRNARVAQRFHQADRNQARQTLNRDLNTKDRDSQMLTRRDNNGPARDAARPHSVNRQAVNHFGGAHAQFRGGGMHRVGGGRR